MKLLQLKYFQTVCKYESITKAAEKLFVSQPTISFCIKELEEEFGIEIPSEDLENPATVADVAKYIEDHQ